MREAVIFGVKNYEEIRNHILERIRGVKPVAVEAGTEATKDVFSEILLELRSIRKNLEKQR